MENEWDIKAAKFQWGLDTRDYYQAAQIDKKIRENPKGKVLVYCGYQHLEKENSSGWKTMAMWLKEMGHEPLCIDQTYMDGSPLLQSDEEKRKKLPYIFEVISPTQFSRPQVILNSVGNYYVPPIYEYNPKTDVTRDKTKRWDITIVHPLPTIKNGRLNYFDGYGYVPVSIPNKWKKKYDEFLVLAYYANEKKDAVPADVIYINSSRKNKTLYLRPNHKYRLELHTPKGDYKCKKINVVR